jgi:hypothetical protein
MGLRTEFEGYWIEVMVERRAKVKLFCHISNERRRITNPHLQYKRRLQHSLTLPTWVQAPLGCLVKNN